MSTSWRTAALDEMLFRAWTHLRDGNADQARKVASVIIEELEPKAAMAHLILCMAHRAMDKLPQAAVSASRALALEPSNASYRKLFQELLVDLANSSTAPSSLANGSKMLLGLEHQAHTPPGYEVANCVDLVLPMTSHHGSELNVIEAARIIRSQAEARIWSEDPVNPSLLKLDPTIRTITPQDFPTGETLAVMGTFFRCGNWIKRVRPRRVILHFNVFSVTDLLWWLATTSSVATSRVDVLFPSKWIRTALGINGEILFSPIDPARFPARSAISTVKKVGRLSRDDAAKHHPADPALYSEFLEHGLDVSLFGAHSIARFLPSHERLTLRKSGDLEPVEFLHQLDAFVYRTGRVFESWGRVVTEAMACGLPVVCDRHGGYAEIIKDTENGFLFSYNDEAVEVIERLRGDGHLVRRIGQAARDTVQELFSRKSSDRLAQYFAAG